MCKHFTDPFRYSPGPLVRKAALAVIEHIKAMAEGPVKAGFDDGKMLGVLVCKDKQGRSVNLAAFSGAVGGTSLVDGFVPPIFDLTDPSGEFRTREAEISAINARVQGILSSEAMKELSQALKTLTAEAEEDIALRKASAAEAKAEREHIRRQTSDPEILSRLIKESQHDKACLKRAKVEWNHKISSLRGRLAVMEEEIAGLKRKAAAMSDALQKWIFEQYRVHNGLGECLSIGEIFDRSGLVPPGGTGDCAAPKLLEHAWRNGLTPLEMGEFWYGQPSRNAVRVQGHFYPSCTSKCGPLLKFMMQGLDISAEDICPDKAGHADTYPDDHMIIYQDEYLIVADKPSGMPSVPGLDGRPSLQEWLCKASGCEVFSVHRLDMDTSGIILFAKDRQTASLLMTDFEHRKVRKTYHALLMAPDDGRVWKINDEGTVTLPLSPDHDERPRQKADLINGKQAVSTYRIMQVFGNGHALAEMSPLTGRTHQLRVHAAHPQGLGCPIAGDMLYGGTGTASETTDGAYTGRLCLHAHSICFTHPHTGDKLTFTSSRGFPLPDTL